LRGAGDLHRRALARGKPRLVHELGLAVDQLDVVCSRRQSSDRSCGPALGFFSYGARVVEVAVVDLADVAGADRLQVPQVADLARARGVLVAEGLALAGVAGDRAALLVEALDRSR
jgi:hypothetical protein